MSKRAWIFCDGSTGPLEVHQQSTGQSESLRNLRATFGDKMACAAAALARNEQGQILRWAWQRLPALTNNEAEYAGLHLGLELAHELGVQEAFLALDSEIVVGQMSGRFGVHSRQLLPWHRAACQKARRIPQVRYCAIPREWNRLADGLAGQAGIPWYDLRGWIERGAKMTG
ncbi:MAG: ribonuclease HI family protein [Caldilineaceae bacterium]